MPVIYMDLYPFKARIANIRFGGEIQILIVGSAIFEKKSKNCPLNNKRQIEKHLFQQELQDITSRAFSTLSWISANLVIPTMLKIFLK